LTEQDLTSPPTQYRLSWRQFYRSKRPNQQYQSTEGKKRYKSKENPEKQTTQNTEKQKNTHKHTKNTENPLVYNNTMGRLGDGSHRGQDRQA